MCTYMYRVWSIKVLLAVIEKSIENPEEQNVSKENRMGMLATWNDTIVYSYVLHTRDNVICNLILHFYSCNSFPVAAQTYKTI